MGYAAEASQECPPEGDLRAAREEPRRRAATPEGSERGQAGFFCDGVASGLIHPAARRLKGRAESADSAGVNPALGVASFVLLL